MNREECIEQLKDLRLHCLSIGYEFDKDAEAIEWILTAYDKEKEERERIGKLYYEANENCIKYEKELEKEKEKNKEYNMGIKNLILQIESAIDFMKTDKSKVKVDMYQQKEEDLKLEIVHLKKLLKEE